MVGGLSRREQFDSREDDLMERCVAAGIEYKPPSVNEKKYITFSRREAMLLLLGDTKAIERRDKKRARDRKRKLTEEQRINKNKKMRIYYEEQKNRRLQAKWEAILNMISKYKNNQGNTQNNLRTEVVNDTNNTNNDDLVYCNDNATISGDTIIFDDHDNCNGDEFGNDESSKSKDTDSNSNSYHINNYKNTIKTSYIYIHKMKPGPHNITKAVRTRGGQRGDMHRMLQQISIF